MIEFINAFATSDGKVFETLVAAQIHAITEIIGSEQSIAAAEKIVTAKDQVIDILTTTKTSRPKARKINGGRKARKTNPEVTP